MTEHPRGSDAWWNEFFAESRAAGERWELEAIYRLPSPPELRADRFEDIEDRAERGKLGFFARWRWRLRR